ncbi:MAG: N-acetyltransferase family protein [Bacteroidota bacterium]
MLEIRKATKVDFDAIWEIFHEVVRKGETFVNDPATTKEEARAFWMADGIATYVASLDGQIVGSYILKANQPGLGSHVANAGYIVKSGVEGKGIGRAMCEHSMSEARNAGFTAMQFNMVVSRNERAVALWKSLGFSIVGTLPKAFRHKTLGLVDAYVMHRFL